MRVAVVGAGVAGLDLARRLAPTLRVHVFEASHRAGGRVRSQRDRRGRHLWETGAGRFHPDQHRRTARLLRRLGVETKEIPSGRRFADGPDSDLDLVRDILERQGPESKPLLSETLAAYLRRLDPKRAQRAMDAFGYSAEFLGAAPDMARTITNMTRSGGYRIAVGGLEQAIKGLLADVRSRGAEVSFGRKVVALERLPGSGWRLHFSDGSPATADAVVLAVPVPSVRRIVGVPEALLEVLRPVRCVPLRRVYVSFPEPQEALKGLKKTTTTGLLRFVIPISPTVLMISYSDGAHAKPTFSDAELQREFRRQFPNLPVDFRGSAVHHHYWPCGVGMWMPRSGVPATALERDAVAGRDGIHVVGENVSAHFQGWIEGALETSESLARLL